MTFYFYDLETSGVNPRLDRIMQFAGQRTDMDLKPIGKPDNILVKMTDDVLPEPEAILVHGLTPQKTRAEGITESEFAKYLTSQVSLPGTIIIGFNNIRFDDEFIRFLLWRNFHDAYEWQWKNDCSRWDLLDTVRMTRALRPDGIKWPFAPDGQPSNKLELLAAVNKLTHDTAHDALSDVRASLAIARLLKNKQPKLFDYLLNLRTKNRVEVFVGRRQPFVYTSGRYPSEFEKTTVAVAIEPHPDGRGMLVYDLRHLPAEYLTMSPAELADRWQSRDEELPQFPVKLLSYNRSPAIAPLSTLDQASTKRLQLNMPAINKNLKLLNDSKDFGQKLVEVLGKIYPPRQPQLVIDEQAVDEQLYDGFVPDQDRIRMSVVRAAEPDQLPALQSDFDDDRLKTLLPLYKARNFPRSLIDQEKAWWQSFKVKKLTSGGDNSWLSRYRQRIKELEQQPRLSREAKSLLKDLSAYAASLLLE